MGLVSGDCVVGVQVAERQLQAWEAAQQVEEEEEELKRAEQLSDALLQQEAKIMAEEGYRPKVGTCQVTGRHVPSWALLSLPCVCLFWLVIASVQRPSLDWTSNGPSGFSLVPVASVFAKMEGLTAGLVPVHPVGQNTNDDHIGKR